MGFFDDLIAAGHAIAETCEPCEPTGPITLSRYYECKDGFMRRVWWDSGRLTQSAWGYSREYLDAERELEEKLGPWDSDNNAEFERAIRAKLGLTPVSS